MHKILVLAAMAAVCAFGQMKTESAGAPPSETAALNASLSKSGTKILKADGSVLCELWLVAAEPTGGKGEENASFATIPHGALLGVIRYPARHNDRRGQTIQPGVYTLRYSLFPVNGDHQGVAPQRDFLILSPAAIDTDPKANLAYDPLMDMSRKASTTPHPLCLSFWKSDAGAKEGLEAGEHDTVLTTKLVNTLVSIILVGKAEG